MSMKSIRSLDKVCDMFVYQGLLGVGQVVPGLPCLCLKILILESKGVLDLPLLMQGVDGSDVTVLKLGGFVFAGQYEETVGTMVLFEETQQTSQDAKPHLKYNCQTTKVLKASRAFLKTKDNVAASADCSNVETE